LTDDHPKDSTSTILGTACISIFFVALPLALVITGLVWAVFKLAGIPFN
jgi:hypothetical protein